MAVRLKFGAVRRALPGVWLLFCCLLPACGSGPVRSGKDGAGTGGLGDGAVEQVAPDSANTATDTLVAGPDARVDAVDAAPDTRDAAPDSVRDLGPDVMDATDLRDVPDVMDATVEATPDTGNPCLVDCSHLPHVRAGAVLGCNSAGVCVVPYGSCEPGFAHCSFNPNDGCEADLSSNATCGSCYSYCYAPSSTCVPQSGSYYCARVCTAPYPDSCNGYCVDFQNDLYNCGTCNHSCYLPNAVSTCVQGQCTAPQCTDPNYLDCTSDPGCETQIGTDQNCAGCGDKSCAIANTLFSCSSANSCASAVCSAGYANCDSASADCEASFAAGGTCQPRYVATTPLATQVFTDAAAAIASDGSYFLAGEYVGLVDFDPTAGQDIRGTAGSIDPDGFITKINADGSYAWTRTFVGRGNIAVHGLAAAAGGAVVAVGAYNDSVDLDPGAAADLHQTLTADRQDAFVVKLAADGSLVWGKTFVGTDFSSRGNAARVAVDSTDAVYVAGDFQSTVDFDPGPAMAVRTSQQQAGMLVKLTAAGAYTWVQTYDDNGCGAALNAVAIASDGALWGVGWATTGPSCALGAPAGNSSSIAALIVSYTAAGVSRGAWSIGGGSATLIGQAVTAGTNGSAYIGGQVQGLVDFDPGAGKAMRWSSWSPGGFILKLASDASFSWVQTVPDVPIVSVAGTPDGGVLGAGVLSGALVTRLGATGNAVWTFTSGSAQTSAATVVARGTSFAVAGGSSGSGDFDSGPDIDIVFGDILYLSRFTF